MRRTRETGTRSHSLAAHTCSAQRGLIIDLAKSSFGCKREYNKRTRTLGDAREDMTFDDDSTSLELNKSTSPRSLRFTLGWHPPAPGSPPAVLNRTRTLRTPSSAYLTSTQKWGETKVGLKQHQTVFIAIPNWELHIYLVYTRL